ncbi:peptidase domain-containing ABC transporter [Pontibacter sp. MBLB2868]|uniref:peptidase domain-containing ABC transporter n=1 Tax=Pontibacter sp. MBLB2868 TaxID=3451555 RepID=UPI003F74C44C
MKHFYKQLDQMDCGPTCLRMVARHYGRSHSMQKLRELAEIGKEGVSLLGIAEAAEKIGLRASGVKLNLEQLMEARLPAVLHWDQNHFVVLYGVKRGKCIVADPARGIIKYSIKEFCEHFYSYKNNGSSYGIALLLEPTPAFYEEEGEVENKASFHTFLTYLLQYKKLLLQLALGLLAGTILQLILPFLTQSVVDVGINTQNLSFIYLVLIAQFMLLLGRTSVDFIRSWILLHMSTRLNVSILSDFLSKLMHLPISFFDTKLTGDIMQRMSDQKRIENFLTNQSLTVLFSLFNLVVFSFVLAFYNATVFFVFMGASILYTLWIVAFLKKRKELDHKRFAISSQNQSAVIQLINGMQEIKLNGCERQKRWDWERIQARLFRYSVKSLSLGQYQQAGAFVINESKNIFIIFLVAKAVISGQMTLGAMMAVQYILGQLNSPVEQLLSFIQSSQDAKISMERLNEIYEIENEEPADRIFQAGLPEDRTIRLKDLSFKYPGAGNEPVLRNINLIIPAGKTTAIVGTSGSGKTTILKLLLGFYSAQKGEIKVGETVLENIKPSSWRRSCGTVMQEGFIFSDTIAHNIAVADERPDLQRLWQSIKAANLQDFVLGLPLGVQTKIGAEGNGISQGQRQRILIARAVYKNPDFIFFDEATNALDANNERVIIENLNQFFQGRTVVVVAHRLSTVRHADQIVVLHKGEIIESGTHESLVAQEGEYFELVKNQLELGV